MKFIEEADVKLADTVSSGDILDEFLDADLRSAKVLDVDADIQGMYMKLRSHAKRNELPVQVRQQKGELYLIRTDKQEES